MIDTYPVGTAIRTHYCLICFCRYNLLTWFNNRASKVTNKNLICWQYNITGTIIYLNKNVFLYLHDQYCKMNMTEQKNCLKVQNKRWFISFYFLFLPFNLEQINRFVQKNLAHESSKHFYEYPTTSEHIYMHIYIYFFKLQCFEICFYINKNYFTLLFRYVKYVKVTNILTQEKCCTTVTPSASQLYVRSVHAVKICKCLMTLCNTVCPS